MVLMLYANKKGLLQSKIRTCPHQESRMIIKQFLKILSLPVISKKEHYKQTLYLRKYPYCTLHKQNSIVAYLYICNLIKLVETVKL